MERGNTNKLHGSTVDVSGDKQRRRYEKLTHDANEERTVCKMSIIKKAVEIGGLGNQ